MIGLTLDPLERAAGLVATGVLALDHAGVAHEQERLLEDGAELGVIVLQRVGDRVSRRASLAHLRRRKRSAGAGEAKGGRRRRTEWKQKVSDNGGDAASYKSRGSRVINKTKRQTYNTERTANKSENCRKEIQKSVRKKKYSSLPTLPPPSV